MWVSGLLAATDPTYQKWTTILARMLQRVYFLISNKVSHGTSQTLDMKQAHIANLNIKKCIVIEQFG